MTDIYINQQSSRKGCLVFTLIFAALLSGGGLLWLHQNRDRAPEPVDTESPAAAAAAEKKTAQTTGAVTVPEGADSGPELLRELRRLKEQEQFTNAREIGFRILEEARGEAVRREAEKLLGEINIILVFSPRPMAEKMDYTVQSGDTLGALARRFNTTVDLIQKSNNLRGSLIRIGDRMRILQGEFSLEVSKSRNDMVVYLNDRFFKRYAVGTGAYERTPAGEFVITDRIPQPTWWSPDGKVIPFGHPDNVLGTHWLSIDLPGYGIHGTWEPETIGHQASAGCVRLLNEEIEELYTLLPVGTQVVIRE